MCRPFYDDLITDFAGSIGKDLQFLSEESWFFADYILNESSNDITRDEVIQGPCTASYLI